MLVVTNASNTRHASFIPFFMRSPVELGGPVLGASHLFKLVQQSLVTDLQLLRRPAPVPTGAGEHAQNDFLLRFPRGGTSRLLQPQPAAVAPRIRPEQHRT